MAGETQPLIQRLTKSIPPATWATALTSRRDASRYVPQTIAHRGYKSEHPENTMAGFKGAIKVGAHALETDLHLSSDGVVVLTHDGNLKRTYGVDKKVMECTWEYLSTLRTVREPHESMPRLLDLLEWLAEPEQEKIWLVLDIKTDDTAEDLLSALAKVLTSVAPSVSWESRVVLGCWNATFLETARRLLPTYPLAIITWSITYAQHFMPVTNVGFNMLHQGLRVWPGTRFLREAQRRDRPVFAWTVNDEKSMRWCLDKNLERVKPRGAAAIFRGVRLLDGVITDDPKLFLEVCARWEDELDGKVSKKKLPLLARVRSGFGTLSQNIMIQVMGTVYHFLGLYVYGTLDFIKDRKALEASPDERG